MTAQPHPDLYTVVGHPEGEEMTVTRFADPIQAERLRTQLVESYVQKHAAAQSRDLDPQVVTSTLRKQAQSLYYVLRPQG